MNIQQKPVNLYFSFANRVGPHCETAFLFRLKAEIRRQRVLSLNSLDQATPSGHGALRPSSSSSSSSAYALDDVKMDLRQELMEAAAAASPPHRSADAFRRTCVGRDGAGSAEGSFILLHHCGGNPLFKWCRYFVPEEAGITRFKKMIEEI